MEETMTREVSCFAPSLFRRMGKFLVSSLSVWGCLGLLHADIISLSYASPPFPCLFTLLQFEVV